MSHLWNFVSFDKKCFDSLFGAKTQAAYETIIAADAAANGVDELDDEEELALCRRLSEQGIFYDGLDEYSADQLDEIICCLFSPDGLEEELNIEYESPDGVHYSTITELVSRLPPATSPNLSQLLNGLRYGTNTLQGNYLILSPEQQQTLLGEIKQAYAAAVTWSDEVHRDITQECLIDVLETIINKGRYCFAHQG